MVNPFLTVEFFQKKKHPVTVKVIISKMTTEIKIIPTTTEFAFALRGMRVRRFTMFKERVTCIT